MAPTRRDVLRLGAAAAVLLPAAGAAASNGFEDAVARFTGGATPTDGGVTLDVPEIADNGGAVPVRVAAPGARRIALFADGNPEARGRGFRVRTPGAARRQDPASGSPGASMWSRSPRWKTARSAASRARSP